MRVTTDDGVGLATLVAARPRPRAAPGARDRGAKEDFADHSTLRPRPPGGGVRPPRPRREDAPDDPAAYSLDRLAADPWPSRRHPVHDCAARPFDGRHVTRRVALARPGLATALVFMDTSAGPPPGLDHDWSRSGWKSPAPRAWRLLKQLSDELDLLGSAAYQRVLAERPGFREYADYKWSAQSPVMWATWSRRSSTSPTSWASWRRSPSLLVIVW